MKKDLVIGLVGTAILVTAMIGVFRFEAIQAGSGYDVTFAPRSVVLPPVDGATNEGQTSAQPVNVTTLNATAVEFGLAWIDQTANSGPDTFNLTVVSPDGVSRSSEGATSPLSVKFDGLTATPPQARVTGASEAEAQAKAATQFASRRGVGVWNVTVKLVVAGDVGQPVNPAPVLQDTGNSWTLTPKITAYEARLAGR